MEAKDVALLGFVSSAKNYINRHINDGTNLDKLNKFDINTLDAELSKQLKHFNVKQEVINSLLNTGNIAFDDFAKDQIENKSNGVLDSLGEVFDVEENKETVEPEKEDTFKENNKIDEFGLTNDDEVLNAIAANASKTNEELEQFNHKVPQDEKMDDVYKEVVLEETKPVESIQIETIKTENTQEVQKEEVKVEQANLDQEAPKEEKTNDEVLKEQSLSSVIKGLAHKDYVNTSSNEETDNQKNEYSTLSQVLKGIAKGHEGVYVPDKKDDVVMSNEDIKEELPRTQFSYIENPGLNIIEPNDLINDEIEMVEDKDEVIENPGAIYEKGISSSLEALQDFANKKEESKEAEYDANEELYEAIAKAYPYLSMQFIKTAYTLKNEVSDGFEFGEKIIILHRISFEELDNLREFVEIIMEHNYSVNVDERKMIVDTFKEFENEDGLILANIYTMANQAKVLNGEYEGYRVIKEEEEE